MPIKKIKRVKPSTRKLVGAVMLTASFSFLAIPDALAESGGCASVSGAMDGSEFGSSSSGDCVAPGRQDTGKSNALELQGGY
jgi:hypothetical protein